MFLHYNKGGRPREEVKFLKQIMYIYLISFSFLSFSKSRFVFQEQIYLQGAATRSSFRRINLILSNLSKWWIKLQGI